MGFKPKRRTFVLEFEDPDLEGLTIKARSATVAEFLTITELASSVGDQPGDAARGLGAVRDLFGAFVPVITDWNLDGDDDQPLPVTVDSLLSLDFPMVMAVIEAWMGGVTDVLGPLGKPSPTTGTGTSTDPVVEASLVGLSSLAS